LKAALFRIVSDGCFCFTSSLDRLAEIVSHSCGDVCDVVPVFSVLVQHIIVMFVHGSAEKDMCTTWVLLIPEEHAYGNVRIDNQAVIGECSGSYRLFSPRGHCERR
jgi:hypothetical protein